MMRPANLPTVALSIRQPWAWLIVNGHKPVENRTWSTSYRGELLIHAGKAFDAEGLASVLQVFPHMRDVLPQQFDLGGIVGTAAKVGAALGGLALVKNVFSTGLAETIYNAMTATHYEGEVNLVAADVPAAPAIGNVVNIASGRAAWATMAAVVQSVSDDYDAGRRTLVLGAPEHLSPQDAIELQRVNRRPEGVTGNRAVNAAMRRDGTL